MSTSKLVLIFFLIPASLLAQDSSQAKKFDDTHGVELTAFLGAQFSNFSNLNGRLKSFNITTLKPEAGAIGFSAAARFGKLIVGVDGSVLRNVYNVIETSGSYFSLYFSTNTLRTKKLIFSPEVGIGYQELYATIVQESAAQNFDEAITTSPNQVKMRHSNGMLDLALKFKTIKRNHYRPILRIGYRYGLSTPSWEIESGPSKDAPKDRGSNFYVQLMFGFGR